MFRKSARSIVRETKVRFTESSEALLPEDATRGQFFFRSIRGAGGKSVAGTERLEIKIQPRPDLLLAAIKAKSPTIIVVEFPIVSRLPLSEGFSLSVESRIGKGREVKNRGKKREGGGGQRRRSKSHWLRQQSKGKKRERVVGLVVRNRKRR